MKKAKVEIKTKTPSGTVRVLESKPRRRVEESEWYYGVLVAAEVKPSHLGEPGDMFLQLDFKLTKHSQNILEDGKSSAEGMPISGLYSLPPRVGNKAHKILSALQGHELKQDEEVNVKAHIGKKFKVLIKDKTTRDDTGAFWQKVELIKAVSMKHEKHE